MNDQQNEKRSETRLEQKTTIFVEVCSSSFDNSTPGSVIICNSLDISANGIQVEMDQEVPIGSVLRLCAEIHDSDQALYLVCETKWVREDGDHFNIGFEIYDAENTDIVGWKNIIADMLAND